MTNPDRDAELTREIEFTGVGQVSPYRISVDPDAFGSVSTKTSKTPRKTDRKLNLRVRKEDNILLKALADQSGVSNTALLNQLLHELLFDALVDVEEVDARALLAREADARAIYDAFERPWCIDVGGRFAKLAVYNAIQWNDLVGENVQTPVTGEEVVWEELHSDLFKKLSRLLEDKP